MGKAIDLSWSKIKTQGVSIGTIVTAITAYTYMFYWLDANFVSEVQGAEITLKVEANHALIVDFKDEYRIKNALDSVRDLKYMRDELEEKELRDGKSELLTIRRRENKADLETATEYKECVLMPAQIRPKCKFLAR